MHSPFDDGDIQCDTAPWRGGMVLRCRKFTFILFLCPAHQPPSRPRCPPPFPGDSVNKLRILASESFAGSALRLLGILVGANWRGNWQSNPDACLCRLPPGLAESCTCGNRVILSFSPPRGKEQGQGEAAVKNTGSVARWFGIQILGPSFSSCVTLNNLTG